MRKSALLTLVCAVVVSVHAPSTATAQPPFIPADAPWLTTVNYYRQMAGLGPVAENASWSEGARAHSCYMLQNDITHDEIPGRPGYTVEGDVAGNNGNVAVWSSTGVSDRSFIELWMTGPFHAIGVLRPGLSTVGYGRCDNESSPTIWKSGATLDVLRGITSSAAPVAPILFPGDGSVTSLSRFVAESPNPLTFCGYQAPAGLPVIAMLPEAPSRLTASITGPSGPVESCGLWSGNTSGTARDILRGDRAVTVVPRAPLSPGRYTVNLDTGWRTVSWSFTVDPVAENGPAPVPVASAVGAPVKFTPTTPFRFVDSRINLRSTRLIGGLTKRVRIAGTGGVPAGVRAVSLNLTVVRGDGPGFVSVYPCTPALPEVSAINFSAGEVVANSGVYPLSAAGDLCFYSKVGTDFVVDVAGWFTTEGSHGFVPSSPTRVVDSREGLGSARLASRGTFSFDASPWASPGDAISVSAVATGYTSPGFLTLWPCGVGRPVVSNLNYPSNGGPVSNMATVVVGTDGRVCGYVHGETDVVIDVHGSYRPDAPAAVQMSDPFRLVDTRDQWRPEMRLGFNGVAPRGVTVVVPLARVRGIPSGVSSVFANLTVVGSAGAGFVTVWPCGSAMPLASSMNVQSATPRASSVVMPVGAGGAACLYLHQPAHIIIDVSGWSA